MTMVNKELYKALLETGVKEDKAASAAMSITPNCSELSQQLIELKNSTTILKLAVLFILLVEVFPYIKIF